MAELSLSEIQASDILEMPLRRLTALARLELETEIAELREAIADFEVILNSDQRRRTLVLKELREMVDAYGRDRRTRIVSPDALSDVTATEAAVGDEPATDEPCVVALSSSGVIGVEPPGGPKAATFGRHDVLIDRVASSTRSTVWGITTQGRAVSATVAELDAVAGRSRGTAVGDAFGLERGEEVLRLVALPSALEGTAAPHGSETNSGEEAAGTPTLLMVSAQGQAKRITHVELVGTRPGQPAMKLKDGDSLVAAFEASDGTDVIMVSSDAQALRTSAGNISVQGRTAGGVAGMKLAKGATVVGAGPVGPRGGTQRDRRSDRQSHRRRRDSRQGSSHRRGAAHQVSRRETAGLGLGGARGRAPGGGRAGGQSRSARPKPRTPHAGGHRPRPDQPAHHQALVGDRHRPLVTAQDAGDRTGRQGCLSTAPR